MKLVVDEIIELQSNAMLVARPELILEWDFERNKNLPKDVYTITQGAGVVWWIGKCGHNFDMRVGDRTRGQNCPYCSNSRVLIGYNDIWTVNSELGKLLLNKEDGYKYTEGSNVSVDFKCEQCNKLFF